jgi:uncharacterized protein (TIGR04255 family)
VDLPKFEQPPVIEVAIAIEFVPLPKLGVVHLVGLAQQWIDEFPQVQEQVALPAQPDPGALLDATGLQFFQGIQPIRLWLLQPDQHLLIQIQHDRLVLNWRRQDDMGSAYPSYDFLRAEYATKWTEFYAYITSRDLGLVRPAVAEVIFVNNIPLDTADLSPVLTSLRPPTLSTGSVLATSFQQAVAVESAQGQGRLTIAANYVPAEKFLNLTLTTRVGLSDGIGDDSILEALDFAHDVDVAAFVDITTPAMHARWRRYQ